MAYVVLLVLVFGVWKLYLDSERNDIMDNNTAALDKLTVAIKAELQLEQDVITAINALAAKTAQADVSASLQTITDSLVASQTAVKAALTTAGATVTP